MIAKIYATCDSAPTMRHMHGKYRLWQSKNQMVKRDQDSPYRYQLQVWYHSLAYLMQACAHGQALYKIRKAWKRQPDGTYKRIPDSVLEAVWELAEAEQEGDVPAC